MRLVKCGLELIKKNVTKVQTAKNLIQQEVVRHAQTKVGLLLEIHWQLEQRDNVQHIDLQQ